jgi:hypothetical protein
MPKHKIVIDSACIVLMTSVHAAPRYRAFIAVSGALHTIAIRPSPSFSTYTPTPALVSASLSLIEGMNDIVFASGAFLQDIGNASPDTEIFVERRPHLRIGPHKRAIRKFESPKSHHGKPEARQPAEDCLVQNIPKKSPCRLALDFAIGGNLWQ